MSPPLLRAGDALFLDFDGTLVDIAATPDAVRVNPDLPGLLSDLKNALCGALATISGRPIGQIDQLLAPYQGAAAGVHGLELRCSEGGPIVAGAAAESLGEVIRTLEAFAAAHSGVMVERKTGAVALHYRAAPDLERACLEVVDKALQGQDQLVRLHGKMVVEARPGNADKGTAINAMMAAPMFENRRPIFIGDDTTDEDGFAYCRTHGGLGIKVGKGDTAAAARLADTAAVHAFLRNSLDTLTGAGSRP